MMSHQSRLALSFAALALARCLLGAQAAGLEGLMPLRAAPSGKAAGRTRLRGDHTVLLYAPAKGAEVRLRVQAVRVGRYAAEILAHGPRADGPRLIVRPRQAGGPESGVLALRAEQRGVVPVSVSTSSNSAVVTALEPHAWLAVEASQRRPLHVIGQAERLHFFVPRAARRFTAFARGGGGRESVRLSVFAPDGTLAGRASAKGSSTGSVKVAVPEEHRGKVWWLKADRAPELDHVFEDAWLWLSDDVPAYVSPQPDGLLAPFVHGLVQPPRWRGAEATPIELSLNVEPPAGAKLHGDLALEGQPVAEAVGDAARPLRLLVPKKVSSGTLELRVRLAGAEGTVLASASSTVTITPTLVFIGHRQPLVRAELVERRGKAPALSVARNVAAEQLPLGASIRLVRTENWEPPGQLGAPAVLRRKVAKLADEPALVEPPPALRDGHYQWQVFAPAPDGALVDVQHAHFLLKGQKLFAEVPPPPSGPMPSPFAAEHAPFPGFFAFVPEAAEAIAYNVRPTRADAERPLRLALARGEREPATIGLLSLVEHPRVTVAVGPLKSEETGAALPVDVRLARHWPQRTSWRTTSYRIVPEMLEPNAPFSMAVGQLKQVWLTVHAPPAAARGRYTAEVRVEAGGRRWTRLLEARVRPFALERPKHVHWGLYSDSARWRKYSDRQVEAELADVAAHGITTLMCYPPYHSKITYEGGKLTIDSRELAKYMRMAKAAGLGPPWVMSMQALRSSAKRLAGGKPIDSPELKTVYQGITKHFVELAKRLDLGECVWHAIDEPWSKDAQAEATVLLGYLEELGLTTFTTAGPVPPAIDKALDVRCYSIGHLLPSPGVLARETRRTGDSGDRLWYYGSGCYTGQDGNLIANRFITGFLFWRSGAEGEWSWTFMRAKGDVHDDFDGEKQREAKEACIVYPSPNEAAPMPTLQWEGIREGIDDYCYAHTLQQLARKAGGEKGKAALAALDRLLATVPIRRSHGDFTAADAQRLRTKLADEIERLLQ